MTKQPTTEARRNAGGACKAGNLTGVRPPVNNAQPRLACWPFLRVAAPVAIRRLLFLMALPVVASAHDIEFTWQHATTRTDGSQITGERVYDLRLTRDGVEVGRAAPTGTDHTFTGLEPGSYRGTIRTVEAGMVGPESAPVDVVIPFPPSAPSGLRST